MTASCTINNIARDTTTAFTWEKVISKNIGNGHGGTKHLGIYIYVRIGFNNITNVLFINSVCSYKIYGGGFVFVVYKS